jgi:hypothetical protein
VTEIPVAGIYKVQQKGPWTADQRKTQRPPQLWGLYMHGVVDHFATPVPWQQLLGDDQSPQRWLDPTVTLRTELKISSMPSLRLQTGDSIELSKPIPMPKRVSGSGTVRVFVWLAGSKANGDAGAELIPSRTPTLDILSRDAEGRTLAIYRGPIHTRGTFNWHCYYVDVPQQLGRVGTTKSAGLFLQLRNPTSGTVWFSTLGTELVDEVNSYTPEEMQDPVTGSLAPFPAMDELVVHLMAGQAYAHPWRFLSGAQGGAGAIPNLTDPAVLREYMLNASKSDDTGSLGGCVFLGPWLYAAKQHPELLKLDDAWHDAFRETLLSLQDPETGFWGTPNTPRSMVATALVVENLWGGPEMPRGAESTPARPWLNSGGGSLPKAGAIMDAVLDARTQRQAGGVETGAWGGLAYEWRDKGETELDICSLAATRNAFVLLRTAGAYLGVPEQARAQRAMTSAWRSVFQLCVLDNGLWKLTARDTAVTRPAFLPRILELSPFLEERTDESIKAPDFTAARNGSGALEFAWKSPSAEIQSVRIFAAPKDAPVEDVHLKHLVGVIERDGSTIWTMDPVRVVGRIHEAALARWGIDISADAAVPLLASRVDVCRNLLGSSTGGEPLAIPFAAPRKRAFFVAAVLPTGEQSKLLPIEIAGLEIRVEEETVEEPAEAPAAEGAAEDAAAGLDELEQPAPEAVLEPGM